MKALVLAILLVCPPAGDARDSAHAALNRLKNRASAPTVPYALATFPEFIGLPKSWPIGIPIEEVGIALDGYVIKVKHSGPESCECHDARPAMRDWHIYLGPRANAALSECVIAEITRYWPQVNPPKVGQHVRVSGWAFDDVQHQHGAEKWRATEFEIHPVTAIQVLP
jgi:hypothetical protein